jgi:hypothetical protein
MQWGNNIGKLVESSSQRKIGPTDLIPICKLKIDIAREK